jgi:hypothetical protein
MIHMPDIIDAQDHSVINPLVSILFFALIIHSMIAWEVVYPCLMPAPPPCRYRSPQITPLHGHVRVHPGIRQGTGRQLPKNTVLFRAASGMDNRLF